MQRPNVFYLIRSILPPILFLLIFCLFNDKDFWKECSDSWHGEKLEQFNFSWCVGLYNVEIMEVALYGLTRHWHRKGMSDTCGLIMYSFSIIAV